MRILLFFITIIFSLTKSYASNPEDSSSRRISILPVPTMGYSPETKAYFGAVCLVNFPLFRNTASRNSNAKIEFAITQRKQRILGIQWNVFSRKENFFYFGNILLSKFVDYYWGIGANTPETNRITFNSHRDYFYAGMAKNTGNKFFIGGALKFQRYLNVRPIDSISSLLQNQPNISSSGLNLLCFKDTRNNLLNAETGKFIRFVVNPNIYREESNWLNYQKLELDARMYHKFKNKLVLAGRVLLQNMSGKSPFFDYNLLGGDQNMRGYYMGRYRDKNIALLQNESRFTIYRRWGFAIFGGAAAVFDEMNDIDRNNFKLNFGGGLRFMVDRKERINMRIDYAVGSKNNHGFYIAFGESF